MQDQMMRQCRCCREGVRANPQRPPSCTFIGSVLIDTARGVDPRGRRQDKCGARPPRSAMLPPRHCLLSTVLVAATAAAQANTIPGRDIQLADTWQFAGYVRAGAFPNGVTAVGAWTTCCNPGTDPIPFREVIDTQHAFIHYLVARESVGRFAQISDWSYVKHTFGSSNDNSGCGSCAGTGDFHLLEI